VTSRKRLEGMADREVEVIALLSGLAVEDIAPVEPDGADRRS